MAEAVREEENYSIFLSRDKRYGIVEGGHMHGALTELGNKNQTDGTGSCVRIWP